ncbi:TPA: hypothetical protein ACH3X2_011963 [Trebouxia sp. C0005]
MGVFGSDRGEWKLSPPFPRGDGRHVWPLRVHRSRCMLSCMLAQKLSCRAPSSRQTFDDIDPAPKQQDGKRSGLSKAVSDWHSKKAALQLWNHQLYLQIYRTHMTSPTGKLADKS